MEQHFKGFNIRVYALCVVDNQILTITESFANKIITKMPGGGLEFGEGIVDCLKREFKEELNLDILVEEPFYIQENFVNSLANDQKQLVVLYFKATILNIHQLKILEPKIKQVQWLSILDKNPFSLPLDQIVFNKLQQKIIKKM
ncbi:NUDIX hydrolase [Myroides sp. JBRI-B21084]|uniref:NUDIX domain-containing protein n=1 Tax=Myroides sp. JBRI-B21084 TaxID=3119977 RepID=UPI0026E1266C|nr:NUDIX hydrolase [Paenimyroides cloacae]WKW45818.1 NUDIX hydrolase [Paenimyroides cloacae]